MVTRMNLGYEGLKILGSNYFNTLYHAYFIIFYNDQQMHN